MPSVEKWKDKATATALYNNIKESNTATVVKVERKEKIEETPLLYDLTTLQKDANTKYGFTAEQTLDITQKLYEKKLVTYPRTGSNSSPIPEPAADTSRKMSLRKYRNCWLLSVGSHNGAARSRKSRSLPEEALMTAR